VCMSFVWSVDKFGLSGEEFCFITPFIAVIVGLLMVSRFRYFSFKSLPMGERQRVPFVWMVGAVLLLALLILDPARVLFVGSTVYLLSGPAWTLWGLATHRRRVRRAAA
jgi:CDP-diacylglycerol--serine O-phosphatidyltransferase